MKISEIISRLGGIRPLARKLGVAPQLVHNWKIRGKIPSWRLSALLALAKQERLGIKAEDLFQ